MQMRLTMYAMTLHARQTRLARFFCKHFCGLHNSLDQIIHPLLYHYVDWFSYRSSTLSFCVLDLRIMAIKGDK